MLPNLKALRAKKGISQQKLADVIGTSQQAINRYENQSVEPDISTLIALADFFETSIDFLVGRKMQANQQRMIPYELAENEAQIIDRFRTLNERQQIVVDLLIDSYQTNYN